MNVELQTPPRKQKAFCDTTSFLASTEPRNLHPWPSREPRSSFVDIQASKHAPRLEPHSDRRRYKPWQAQSKYLLLALPFPLSQIHLPLNIHKHRKQRYLRARAENFPNELDTVSTPHPSVFNHVRISMTPAGFLILSRLSPNDRPPSQLWEARAETNGTRTSPNFPTRCSDSSQLENVYINSRLLSY